MVTMVKSSDPDGADATKTTVNNGSLGELSIESYSIDPVKEKKMMRKFDVRQSLSF
jgi:hypothetical protein